VPVEIDRGATGMVEVVSNTADKLRAQTFHVKISFARVKCAVRASGTDFGQ
jgi:hypothetical protein